MNIILLGMPGAGKGTQATTIVDHLAIPHISTGELFRKAYQEKTELGLLAKQYMDKGELLPNEITVGIATRRISESDCSSGFLLDGFPRNLIQAEALEEYLQKQNKEIDHAIYVEVEEGLLFERLTGRRVCGDCGATFHTVFNPSKKFNECDQCQGALIQRSDDQEETVLERLKVNKELTSELVQYYKQQGKLRVIDGAKEINEVTEELLGLLS